MDRRRFLVGLAAAVAAPAIVRSGLLMPVKKMILPVGDGVALRSLAHPEPWILPRGQLLNRHAYPELASVLGYQFGGSGDLFRAPFIGQPGIPDTTLKMATREMGAHHTGCLVYHFEPGETNG